MKPISKPGNRGADEALSLSKVLGLTTVHGSAMSSTCQTHQSSSLLSFTGTKYAENDLLFYAAGSVVVAYSSHDNDQKAFYASATHQPVSCLAVSSDGKYLAIGERGHRPSIVVWDLAKQEKVSLFAGHQHGVGALVFCPRGRYLVSAGFQHDKTLRLWDWTSGRLLNTQKLSNKVYALSCDPEGAFFVTAGEKHLKWWYLTEVLDGEAAGLEGKPAGILEDMRRSVFVDVVCGGADKVFCVTQQGLLCQFNAQERVVEKVVQIDARALPAYSLELIANMSMSIVEGESGESEGEREKHDALFVGLANGAVQAFSSSSLALLADLPRPCPLSPDEEDDEDEEQESEKRTQYGACYALRQVPRTAANPLPKLCAVYADRSMCVWDLSDVRHAMAYRSFTAHRSTVWDVQFLQQSSIYGESGTERERGAHSAHTKAPLPHGTFATCSADNTVRFWNLDSRARRSSRYKSSHSRDMLHAVVLRRDAEREREKEARLAAQRERDGVDESLVASTATGLSVSLSHAATNPSLANLASNAQGGEFDFSRGVPDVELPARSLSPGAPRVLAVHPLGAQLAVGDAGGRLTALCLRSMAPLFATQAHSAEILAMCFSPAMASQDGGQSWTVTTEREREGETAPLVLLATAGRDRLIHVFDASPSLSADRERGRALYAPLDTLDHHSASVTALRFTPDGLRLLSSGGDKTIVVCTVHGATLRATRSISTGGATVQGLCVDPAGRFAVSAGQDAKLGIWNLHSGKCTRAYKPAAACASTRFACSALSTLDEDGKWSSAGTASSALYKAELDASGSFIATCAFDKSISLVDFFSGERLGSVSGHGELVTGLRFSPDGRSLVSVGGEGCVFVWAVAPVLVQSMRERLSELCGAAQRRIARASASVSLSSSSSSATTTTATTTAPRASLVMLKDKLRLQQQQQSVESLSVSPSPSQSVSVSQSTAGLRRNRWLDRDAPAPFEIGGRRVDASADPAARHRLTLELTSAVTTSASPEKSESEREKETHERVSSLAATIAEDADGVVQAALSEEEEDEDEGMGEGEGEGEEYAADFEPAVDAEKEYEREKEREDHELDEASRKIDTLEKTAEDLESWLENMLRNEVSLDPHSSVAAEEEKDPLSKSLSSAFFRSAKHAPPQSKKLMPPLDTGDNLLPPPPVLGEPLSAEELEAQLQTRKLRESASTLAQMRERLRAMDRATSESPSALGEQFDAAPPAVALLPPPPPSREEEQRQSKKTAAPLRAQTENLEEETEPLRESKESLFDTPRDSESDREGEEGEEQCRPTTSMTVSQTAQPIALPQSIAELLERTSRYKKVLSDLELAKKAAAESFQELQELRTSLASSSMIFGDSADWDAPTSPSASHGVLAQSLQETDVLLAQFRHSLAQSASPRFDASMSLAAPETSQLLEKYSDQLLDMVTAKMKLRLEQL